MPTPTLIAQSAVVHSFAPTDPAGTFTLPITIGVTAPAGGVLIVFFRLHGPIPGVNYNGITLNAGGVRSFLDRATSLGRYGLWTASNNSAYTAGNTITISVPHDAGNAFWGGSVDVRMQAVVYHVPEVTSMGVAGVSGAQWNLGSYAYHQNQCAGNLVEAPPLTPGTGRRLIMSFVDILTTGSGNSHPSTPIWTPDASRGFSELTIQLGVELVQNVTPGTYSHGHLVNVAYREIDPPSSSTVYRYDGVVTTSPNCGGVLGASDHITCEGFFLASNTLAPPTSPDVSQARGPGAGLLIVATVTEGGEVMAARYNTALPPAIAGSATLEVSGGTGVSLVALRGGRYELLYAHSGSIKRTITKDGGRTWSVATTIASGYQDVVHLIDPHTGVALAALWKESENTWYLATGERASGTGDHVYTVRGVLVASAKRGASLIRTAGRRYEFAYRTTGDVLTIIRCKAQNAASVGTWS